MGPRQSQVDIANTVIQDEVSGNLSYFGRAKPGSATSAPVWQILRVQKVGKITTKSYAEGKPQFMHVWDNRATFNYS